MYQNRCLFQEREVKLPSGEKSCVLHKCYPGTNHFLRVYAMSKDDRILDASTQLTVQTAAPPDTPLVTQRWEQYHHVPRGTYPIVTFTPNSTNYSFRVATTQGKQGIWFLLFQDRENTGNFAVTQGNFLRHRENILFWHREKFRHRENIWLWLLNKKYVYIFKFQNILALLCSA